MVPVMLKIVLVQNLFSANVFIELNIFNLLYLWLNVEATALDFNKIPTKDPGPLYQNYSANHILKYLHSILLL